MNGYEVAIRAAAELVHRASQATARPRRASGSTAGSSRTASTRRAGAIPGSSTPRAARSRRSGAGRGRPTAGSSTTAPARTPTAGRGPSASATCGGTSARRSGPGTTCRTSRPTKRPDYRAPADAQGMDAISGTDPFIMMADGRAWLFSPSGLLDGPLPTHYEPLESPLPNLLYPKLGSNPTVIRWQRPENPYHPTGDPRFPVVATTFRLTEHHTAGGMSRFVPWLVELQPEMFAEIDPQLAADRGIEDGGWMTIVTERAEIEARAKVTHRMRPLRDRRARDPPGRAPVALGLRRPLAGRFRQRSRRARRATRTSRSRSRRRSPATYARVAGTAPAPPGWRARTSTAPPISPGRGRPAGREPRRGDAMSTGAPQTEIAIHRAGARADGVLHRHHRVHRLQGVRGRVQAVERPARRRRRGRARAPPMTTRASCRPRPGVTCASSSCSSPHPSSRTRRERALDAGAGGQLPAIPAAGNGGVDVAEAVAKMGDWVFMSDVCKHCTNAGCLDACPTGALIRTEYETVVLQPDVCNGCGYCVPACPFGVVDRDQFDGRAGKCTLCYDRLEDGLEPACAKSCPTDSIQFGPHEAAGRARLAPRRRAARARNRRRLPVRRRRRSRRAARRWPRARSSC